MKAKTIMVIDDDLDLRESIVEILEGNKFTAIGCASAEIALEKIEIENPHLIIVDNMMPGMGGMAFIPLVKNKLILRVMSRPFKRNRFDQNNICSTRNHSSAFYLPCVPPPHYIRRHREQDHP